jgi:hypothetical protein
MLIFYILFSIFLSFVINYYYIRELSTTFFFYFLIVFAVLFILFYFLAFPKKQEKQELEENFEIYDDSFGNIGESYSFAQEEEMIQEEEEQKESGEEESEEESHPEEEEEISQTEEEEMKNNNQFDSDIPFFHSRFDRQFGDGMNRSITSPSANAYGPLNINISYNGKNTINEVDGTEKKRCEPEKRNTGSQKYLSDNPSSRIYDQSDWIKSYTAWSDSPDYYIPRKTDDDEENEDQESQIKRMKKRNLDNEIYASYKYNEKCSVCPLMAEQPWSSYQSGDKEPIGYNI